MPVSESQQLFASELAYINLDEAYVELKKKGKPVTLEAALEYAYERGESLDHLEAYMVDGKLKEEYSYANDWVITGVTNQNMDGGTGLYAMIIDTGEANILTCRGSEDMKEFRNVQQDWLDADLGLLNSTMTTQEEALQAFMEANAEQLNKKPWVSTGHSLGGALADYAAVMSVKMGLDNYAGTINFDGPGHSKEFIEKYAYEISRVCGKMVHLKASIVGNILFDLPGVRQEHITTEDVGLIEEHFMNNWIPEDGRLKRGDQSTVEYIVEKATRGADNLPSIVGDTLAEVIVYVVNGIYWVAEFAEDHPLVFKTVVKSVCLYLLKHPAFAVKVLAVAAKVIVVVIAVVAVIVIGQIVYEFLEKMVQQIVDAVCAAVSWLKDKSVELYQTVMEGLRATREFLRSLTPGAKYAQNNPRIRADTAELRAYAASLSKVNKRLTELDKDLDSLYWQVGLLDLAEIITTNVITGYSASLLLAKTFLNDAADKLESAENKALGYVNI